MAIVKMNWRYPLLRQQGQERPSSQVASSQVRIGAFDSVAIRPDDVPPGPEFKDDPPLR